MDTCAYIGITSVPFLLILIGLAVTVSIDPYINRSQRVVLLLIVGLTVCTVIQNGLSYLLEVRIYDPPARTWISIIGYSIRPLILVLFLYLVGFKFKSWLLWTLVLMNWLIHMTALFTPKICFVITGSVLVRGPLGYTCHLVSGILLAILLFRTIQEYRSLRRAEIWIPICNALLIVVSVILESVVFQSLQLPVTFLTMSMVCCSLFFYIWLHLRFVSVHENALMAEQRVQIMMTQIQPHFLFNALNTIRALYARDAALGDKMLENFCAYLRQNLESLNQTELIPITKEVEHTRLYAEIERYRFPNILVEYRIEDEQFESPALTIQPLVENAIRHGVRSRKDGLVTVSTVREAGFHRITVQDNGVGFDPEKEKTTEESHIGIRNVRERVEQMCGGKMILRSEIGKGTCVTLLIPNAASGDRRELKR